MLSEALDLDIEIGEVEGRVGNLRLDLAGAELRTQRPIVIENQFGRTDHDHLGKLLTYAADREAANLVWIAMEFQAPHKVALDWLNRVTGKELAFYGVELEVFQIDESRPAPRFAVVAQPSDDKRPPTVVPDLSPRGQAYQRFWQRFIDYLKEHHPGLTRSKAGPSGNWFYASMGFSSYGLGVNFPGDGRFRVELYLDTGNKEETEIAFWRLKESEAQVHEQMGEPLIWDPLPEARACRIYLPRAGTIDDSEEQLTEYIAWGGERMARMKDVFKPLLSDLVASWAVPPTD